jgi:hypothetical protein
LEKTRPFDQLNPEDQMAAIDVAVSTVLIGLRIPSANKPLYDFIATEFASCRQLPANVVRYALRSLGRELFDQDWTLTIEKREGRVVTKFSTQTPILGADGEQLNGRQQ